MPTKTWTVTTPGTDEQRTLTHEQMLDAIFEAMHGFGFTDTVTAAATEQTETRETRELVAA